MRSKGDARNHYMLLAAREWLKLGYVDLSEGLLVRIPEQLSTADRSLLTLLRAEVALHRNDPYRALMELDALRSPLSAIDESAALKLRVQALFSAGRSEEAAVVALERERLLHNKEEMNENRRMLWNGIQANAAAMVSSSSFAANRTVRGWLELAPAALQTSRNAFAAVSEIDAWRERYPSHAANEFLTEEVLPSLRAATSFPSTIALALPLSGPQQPLAELVRDGFIAALLQSEPERRPILNVYDSEDGAEAVYHRAIDDGADFFVGPLLKEQVGELIDDEPLAIPTLALNYPANHDAVSDLNLFQFWLDPEAEARQVAARVIDDGASHGIALLPNNDWGRRVFEAFESELRQLGGSLEGKHFYDPKGSDYVGAVAKVLLIDESQARIASLNSALHTRLEFRLRPRADIDFIFIGGEPLHGQMFRSGVRLYLDRSMPVYATSEVFDPNLRNNTDMNDIRFPDMPWVLGSDKLAKELRATIEGRWPQRGREASRLFAFGFDACRLIPMLLSQTSTHPMGQMFGLTGRLTVDEGGYVHHQLDWAQIQNGHAVITATAAGDSSAKLSVRSSDNVDVSPTPDSRTIVSDTSAVLRSKRSIQ